MARDHARLQVGIWADSDWRGLPMASQWLYTYLLSSPKLSYAGVADWRPKRIAAFTLDGSADLIEKAALPLETEQPPLLLIDRDTEEALIRTFVRHDGVLTVPNVAIATAKAWQDTASEILRGVIAEEVVTLYQEDSDLPAFREGNASWPWMQSILGSELIGWERAVDLLDPNPTTKSVRRVK